MPELRFEDSRNLAPALQPSLPVGEQLWNRRLPDNRFRIKACHGPNVPMWLSLEGLEQQAVSLRLSPCFASACSTEVRREGEECGRMARAFVGRVLHPIVRTELE